MCVYFHVLDRTEPGTGKDDVFCEGLWRSRQTGHFHDERMSRAVRVTRLVGLGHPIRQCLVDTGHRNGLEVHVLTDTGLVFVYNHESKELVTVLIARPGQVKRYYEPFGEDAPKELIARAYENTSVHHWNF